MLLWSRKYDHYIKVYPLKNAILVQVYSKPKRLEILDLDGNALETIRDYLDTYIFGNGEAAVVKVTVGDDYELYIIDENGKIRRKLEAWLFSVDVTRHYQAAFVKASESGKDHLYVINKEGRILHDFKGEYIRDVKTCEDAVFALLKNSNAYKLLSFDTNGNLIARKEVGPSRGRGMYIEACEPNSVLLKINHYEKKEFYLICFDSNLREKWKLSLPHRISWLGVYTGWCYFGIVGVEVKIKKLLGGKYKLFLIYNGKVIWESDEFKELWLKDLDFERKEIIVKVGKEYKTFSVNIPQEAVETYLKWKKKEEEEKEKINRTLNHGISIKNIRLIVEDRELKAVLVFSYEILEISEEGVKVKITAFEEPLTFAGKKIEPGKSEIFELKNVEELKISDIERIPPEIVKALKASKFLSSAKKFAETISNVPEEIYLELVKEFREKYADVIEKINEAREKLRKLELELTKLETKRRAGLVSDEEYDKAASKINEEIKSLKVWAEIADKLPDEVRAIAFVDTEVTRVQLLCPHCGKQLPNEMLKVCPYCFNDLPWGGEDVTRIYTSDEAKSQPTCPNCGKEVREEDKFCSNCGYKLK